jgi:hypothetical protein
MSLINKRPGELLLAGFITAGIVLTIAVTVVESLSATAGRVPGHAFDSGIIDARTVGSSWDASVHGK